MVNNFKKSEKMTKFQKNMLTGGILDTFSFRIISRQNKICVILHKNDWIVRAEHLYINEEWGEYARIMIE